MTESAILAMDPRPGGRRSLLVRPTRRSGTLSGMAQGALSVSAVVRRWAQRVPERVCLSFHAGGSVEQVTYGELAGRASAHARLYREHGLVPGDAVVLLAHSAPGFVEAFLGAQEAGLLAVPCPPPEPLESARRVSERMREILTRCRARALLGSGATPREAELSAALAETGVIVLAPPTPGAVEPEQCAGDAHGYPLAYCQFTSGSGGRAKGVLLTHDNLAANIQDMVRCFDRSPDEITVTWLPLYHDMGLVSYILKPLVVGHAAHVMAPLAFLAQPISWLTLMTRVRGTVSSGPNVAYGLCARKASDEDVAALDLSAWSVACNGSEPVTRAAVEAFTRRFAPCGFRASALLPC